MAVSSYQVQRLLSRLRRGRAAQPKAAAGKMPEADRVQLSERARRQAAEAAASLRLPAGTPVSVATIVDDAPLAPETLRELERRAGSFMRPPLEPAPAPSTFPRARRPFAQAEAPEPLHDEDFPEGFQP